MEFYKINAKNYEMNVVFNGGKYVFFNGYCGIAAIAERTTPDEKIASGEESFVILYGNEHLIGGSIGEQSIVPYVKKLVNKCESQYIKTEVKYELKKVDLSKWYATIEVKER